MRFLSKLLLLAGVIGLLVYGVFYSGVFPGTEDPSGHQVKSVFAPPNSESFEYPKGLRLVNQEGVALEVNLLARNNRYIEFERIFDGSEHLYLIESLSPDSQKLVLRFPDTGLSMNSGYANTAKLTKDEVYVESLRGSIEKIDLKLNDLSALSARGVDAARARSIRQQMNELTAEKHILLDRINDYTAE